MKKTLIALAVLAASGAAMAQSTVTLYGVADVWLGSNKVEGGTVDGKGVTFNDGIRQNVINTSGVNGSRWGLKGSEDLGGGLKAIFTLENGFNLDNGGFKTTDKATGTSTLFDRQAFVGVQGGFGTVSMGRQYSAYDNLHGAVDHNYDAFTFSATGNVAKNGMVDYTSRVNNSIQYISPDFSGFSGAVVYSFGENKTATNDATDSASMHVKYANGPLLVGYAYQEEKTVSAGVEGKNKYNLIGGTYDFGVAKLVGSYNTAKNSTFNDKEYQVGVVVPFGAAAISGGYAHSKSESAGGVETKGDGFSLLGTYALSKRTGLYAGAQSTKAHLLNEPAETKTTTYGLGMRHSF